MARKRQEAGPPEPEVDPTTGIRLLETQIQKARELLAVRPLSDDKYSQWENLTRNYLEKAFGRNSPNVSTVTEVGAWAYPRGGDEIAWEKHRAEKLTTQVTHLEGLVELLQTEAQLRQASAIASPAVLAPAPHGHRVFLVHGHAEAALHEVARFLERVDQEIIVLREQPNRGRTIIEKFEEFGNVGFAVVLLTADDRGGPADAPYENQQLRPRQNVVLELGYFLGRRGRSRVCAVYEEGVEIPSDYSGVLYVRLDSGGAWRLQLARELKAAGFPIDMNKAV